MELTLVGDDALKARLINAGINAAPALGMALFAEANLVMKTAKMLAPLDTGVLMASGFVRRPTFTMSGAEVQLGFGGAASAYALVQHEREDYQHNRGQAHYLSEPLQAMEPYIMGRLAGWVEKLL